MSVLEFIEVLVGCASVEVGLALGGILFEPAIFASKRARTKVTKCDVSTTAEVVEDAEKFHDDNACVLSASEGSTETGDVQETEDDANEAISDCKEDQNTDGFSAESSSITPTNVDNDEEEEEEALFQNMRRPTISFVDESPHTTDHHDQELQGLVIKFVVDGVLSHRFMAL